ncbi:preprotein translocase subunit SecE [Candidatus Saganbacteria bacterium CG08_land_8_20_14_0_20_45_16]|uniref:Protein translocase subunit SecE n=1 Tax=Candidatus Saganbacteria bacterium CG08_land_8_20_14_0_20_45_16 TaxID=2014293 RepID=A0A2H0XXE7_UNCSA|nr:MAG: preprotein translocase subunit SecE [Candidatus Saganbacteria bacterium CG08_land_8_20_14_0_20_45_16]
MKKQFEKLVNFLKETRAETRKVVWPDHRYVLVATGIILVLTFLTGLYIMCVDFVFGKMFVFLR